MHGSLYIVPTPIGNLGDITLRALEVLKSVTLILAEDTRTSGKLLKHYDISTPLRSYHMHNEHRILTQLVTRIKAGETMALISDAGTPGISDPGFLLIRECLKEGIEVNCLPGATALIPALVNSGFPTDRFVFEGFLPLKKGRQTRLQLLSGESRTLVFYESPHKLLRTLTQFVEYFGGDRQISVSRELTKMYEETLRGTTSEVLAHFENNPPKGELVLVVEGRK
ncbi:16S rRNA (cytidine(1402)-2'-O)-methyltransferase [Robiginitalea sp.]|jgi:16S rRNA (cytidine1402-2'-O)-methyltransferase|uniref:16S rRNA (cytidine(1402)-2'-O)-methyltransferase n=1 Tax=Robiginitalea sp. TaxID=1902411 RepID=UPI003C774BAA